MSKLPRASVHRFFLAVFLFSLAASSGIQTHGAGAAAEGAGIQTIATVTSDTRVWLRDEPNSDAKVVAKIDSGTEVTLLDGPKADGWYYVKPSKRSKSKAGWVNRSRLVFDHFALVDFDSKLREKPFDESPTLTNLAAGTVVTIAGPKAGAFVRVMYGDEVGFAEAALLEPSAGPATVPPPPPPTGEWWVDVNRSTWVVSLMIGTTAIASYPASLSRDPSDGFYGTATGTYYIYEKIEGLQYTTYAKAYFMYWAGFDPYRFNGFHSWTMNSAGYVKDGGWGPTKGCVATAPADALAIYNFVGIGTRVEIHW